MWAPVIIMTEEQLETKLTDILTKFDISDPEVARKEIEALYFEYHEGERNRAVKHIRSSHAEIHKLQDQLSRTKRVLTRNGLKVE